MAGLIQRLYLHSPAFIQNLVLSAFAWQRRQVRYGRDYREAQQLLCETEHWSAEQLRQYQESCLRTVIHHAYENVPYYRETMNRIGVTPHDCHSLAGLAALPVLHRTEVQRHAKRLRSTVPVGPVDTIQTSGTTGTSLTIAVTRRTLGIESAVVWRQRQRAGVLQTDRLASFTGRSIIHPDQRHAPFWRHNYSDHQLMFSYYHVSDATLPLYIRAYNDFSPAQVQGYPSFLYLVAEFALRSGMGLRPAKAIFTSSETLHAWQREAIEAAFGAPVFDHYGSGEKVAAISQCERGRYHIDLEFGIIEVIDGTIVATTLHNLAMPLIRYSLDDAVRFLDTKCPCGRSLPVVTQPTGRTEDLIVTPDGRKFGRLDHLFKATRAVREAQLIQESADRLTVLVVPSGIEALSIEAVVRAIREKLGTGLDLSVQIVDQIPRTKSGKFRFVISRLRGQETDPNQASGQ